MRRAMWTGVVWLVATWGGGCGDSGDLPPTLQGVWNVKTWPARPEGTLSTLTLSEDGTFSRDEIVPNQPEFHVTGTYTATADTLSMNYPGDGSLYATVRISHSYHLSHDVLVTEAWRSDASEGILGRWTDTELQEYFDADGAMTLEAETIVSTFEYRQDGTARYESHNDRDPPFVFDVEGVYSEVAEDVYDFTFRYGGSETTYRMLVVDGLILANDFYFERAL